MSTTDLRKVIEELEAGPAVKFWTLYNDKRVGCALIQKEDLLGWLRDAENLESVEDLLARALEAHKVALARVRALEEEKIAHHGGVHSPEFTAAFEALTGVVP